MFPDWLTRFFHFNNWDNKRCLTTRKSWTVLVGKHGKKLEAILLWHKNSIVDGDILFAGVLELEEFLKNSWTTAVLGFADDAKVPALLTHVDMVVAVITDDVTLIKWDTKEGWRGVLPVDTVGVSLASRRPSGRRGTWPAWCPPQESPQPHQLGCCHQPWSWLWP